MADFSWGDGDGDGDEDFEKSVLTKLGECIPRLIRGPAQIVLGDYQLWPWTNFEILIN